MEVVWSSMHGGCFCFSMIIKHDDDRSKYISKLGTSVTSVNPFNRIEVKAPYVMFEKAGVHVRC